MANILLIEPDSILNKTYAQALIKQGHTVSSAKTIERAIQLLDQEKIELVITEIQIALHNGLEFIYEMRSYPEWQSIPIIINSFVPANKFADSNSLNQLNIADVLYKPNVSLKQLCDKVSQHILLAA